MSGLIEIQVLHASVQKEFIERQSHRHEIDLLGDRLKVNSYHNYAIKSIENAKILASSTDGYIEAFSNEKFKILGAMWHFEREAKPSEASKKIFEILKGLK